MADKRKFRSAARKFVDVVDICAVTDKRCLCVAKAEKLLRQLVRELKGRRS